MTNREIDLMCEDLKNINNQIDGMLAGKITRNTNLILDKTDNFDNYIHKIKELRFLFKTAFDRAKNP